MNRVVVGKIERFCAHYHGEAFHAPLNVGFPDDAVMVAMGDGICCLLLIVDDVVNLDARQVSMVIDAWIGMPEGAMRFKNSVGVGQIEVEQKPTQAILLSVVGAFAVQHQCHFGFEFIVRLARATVGNLLRSQTRMALAGVGIAELLRVGIANLGAGFGGMCTAKHTIPLTTIGSGHLDAERTKNLDHATARYIKPNSNLWRSLSSTVKYLDRLPIPVLEFSVVLTRTRARTILAAPGLDMTRKGRGHKSLAAVNTYRGSVVPWHMTKCIT